MSDETILLPCPFCGSEARMLGTKERWFNPACSNSECGCEWTDSYVTEAEAIAAWNTRATHGTLTAEQVREAIEHHGTASLGCRWQFTDRNLQAIADELNAELGNEINGDTSDGYHTFNELYHHRAVLFSVIVRDHRELAWKARKHHDGTMYDGMFIVGIETPKGQATYHYDLDPYWDMFDCEERELAPEWDGHTPDEAIARIAELESGTCRLHYGEDDDGYDGWYCDECSGWFQAVRRDGHLVNPKHCQECGKAVER